MSKLPQNRPGPELVAIQLPLLQLPVTCMKQSTFEVSWFPLLQGEREHCTSEVSAEQLKRCKFTSLSNLAVTCSCMFRYHTSPNARTRILNPLYFAEAFKNSSVGDSEARGYQRKMRLYKCNVNQEKTLQGRRADGAERLSKHFQKQLSRAPICKNTELRGMKGLLNLMKQSQRNKEMP